MAKFEIVGLKCRDERKNKAVVEAVDRKVTDKQKCVAPEINVRRR